MSLTKQEFTAATKNAAYLDGRLRSNERFGTHDLNTWILSFVRVDEGDRVLDVCCGTGKQLLEYARLAGPSGEVHGLDASAEALDQIRRSLPPETAHVVLHQSQLEDIPVDLAPLEGFFDWITCSYGLYYSKNPEQTVHDLRRLLKPEGRLAVIGPARRNNESFFALIERVAEIPEFVRRTSTVFVDDTLIPTCRQLFRDVTIHQFDNDMVYPDAEGVINYWRSCGTYFKESAVPELRQLLQAHFADHNEFRVGKQALGVVCSDPV